MRLENLEREKKQIRFVCPDEITALTGYNYMIFSLLQ